MELTFVVVENDLDYYIDLFLRVKRATKKPNTIIWYSRVLGYYRDTTAHIRPDWPPTLAHVQVFLEKYKGLKDYSRNNYYRALRAFLNWLKKTNYITQNPLDFFDPIPPPKPLPKAPPEEDVKALLVKIKNDSETWLDIRDLALFLVALDTAARPGELAAMKVEHVDLSNKTIRVYSNKDYEDRNLVFGDDAAEAMTLWFRQYKLLALPPELRVLWVSHYQGRWRSFTHWGIRQRLRHWQEKAGIDRFTPYAIRHAYAIYSLRNLADLLDIRDQMGHASITTTAKYTKVVNTDRQKRHQKTSPVGNLLKKE